MTTGGEDSDPSRSGYQQPITRYKNVVSLYMFPTIYVLGLVNNLISFVVILRSSIIKTSIGVYLATLAWADCFASSILVSQWWATIAFGQDFHLFRLCSVNKFTTVFSLTLASVCVLCVTTDRFIAVWFPFKAKFLVSKRRSIFIVAGIILGLFALESPILWALTPNCAMKWNFMRPYMEKGLVAMLNLLYSYGTSVCLLLLNIAIAIRLAKPGKRIKATQRDGAFDRSAKAAVTALAVSIAFLVFSSPFNIVFSTIAARQYITGDPYKDEIILTLSRFMSLV